MSDPAGAPNAQTRPISVRVDDVHVRYRLSGGRAPMLRAMLAGGKPVRRPREVHAVKGVSLTVRAGDAVGVIGRNGSGKSTLLRAIAGLLPTTSGSIEVSALPTLLGVSSALKKELTGRENAMLGGTALGMKRRQLDELMDGILEFSGLEGFIDMPLRTYSSGMKARLQFAIATAVRPEILLIDETLAVGDEEFKERSEERIHGLIRDAGTVFVVSHGLGILRDTCNRGIWLDAGQLRADGPIDDVIAEYRAFVQERKREKRRAERAAQDQA